MEFSDRRTTSSSPFPVSITSTPLSSFPPTSSSPTQSPTPPSLIMSPCAACKILRRRCVDNCVLAPYFPPTDPLSFTIAHKVFGAGNIIKLLQVCLMLLRESFLVVSWWSSRCFFRGRIGFSSTVSVSVDSSGVARNFIRALFCESLRGELSSNVWRRPSRWSQLGGGVHPRCELEEVLSISYHPQPRQCNWSERSSSERSSGTSTTITGGVFCFAAIVGAALSRSAGVGFGCGSSLGVDHGVFLGRISSTGVGFGCGRCIGVGYGAFLGRNSSTGVFSGVASVKAWCGQQYGSGWCVYWELQQLCEEWAAAEAWCGLQKGRGVIRGVGYSI